MLTQRLRLWPNIKRTLDQRLELNGQLIEQGDIGRWCGLKKVLL